MIGNMLLILFTSVFIIVILYKISIRKFYRTVIQISKNRLEIGIRELFYLALRNKSYDLLINEWIKLENAGIKVKQHDLESISFADGDLNNISEGLIYAKNNGLDLKIEKAIAADQIGKNIKKLIKNWMITNPNKMTIENLK